MNKYRLSSSNVFDREEENDKIEPKKIIFLSTEGMTEIQYLHNLNVFNDQLGLNSSILVKPLERKKEDGKSAPEHVVGLLEEYLELRNKGIAQQIEKILTYPEDVLHKYISNPSELNPDLVNRITLDLYKADYDLEYHKWLDKNKNPGDIFGIVIDKDKWELQEVVKHCAEKGYKVFLSNPCFELWLLLHFEDVSSFPESEIEKLKKDSERKHKHVYKLLQKHVKHGKTNLLFESEYLNRVNDAISNAKKITTDLNKLVNEVGTNWPDLIDLLKE